MTGVEYATEPFPGWPDDDASWRAVAKRWECLYRAAAGLPASEHSRRRLEAMAQRCEEREAAMRAEVDELRAELAATRIKLAAARLALAAVRDVRAAQR